MFKQLKARSISALKPQPQWSIISLPAGYLITKRISSDLSINHVSLSLLSLRRPSQDRKCRHSSLFLWLCVCVCAWQWKAACAAVSSYKAVWVYSSVTSVWMDVWLSVNGNGRTQCRGDEEKGSFSQLLHNDGECVPTTSRTAGVSFSRRLNSTPAEKVKKDRKEK